MKKRILSLLLALCLLVCAGVVQPESALAESFRVYVTANNLKVYKKVSTSSGVLGTMAYGERMTCVAYNDKWAAVKNSDGDIGFCKISGLSTKNPNQLDCTAYVKKDDVPVYRRPDDDSDVMMRLKKGSSYEAVAMTKDGDWVRLKNGKYYGYVQAKYLSITAAEAEPQPEATPKPTTKPEGNSTVYVTATTLKVYQKASTSSKTLGTMSYGESMVLVAQSGSWSKVRNEDGDIGYCKSSGVSHENPNDVNQTIYINGDKVKVYRKPSTSAGVMQTLRRNESYTCVAITPDGKWARLQNGKYFGYVQAKYISDLAEEDEDDSPEEPFEQRTVYIHATTLEILESARETADVLGVMSFGESLTLTNVDDGWAQVRNAKGDLGYCSYGALRTTNPNAQRLTFYAAQDGVKLYAKAMTSAKVAKTINTNANLTVVAISEDEIWGRVQVGSSHAYVLLEQLSETRVAEDNSDMQDVEPFTVYITATNLTIYASNSSSSDTIASLSFGESLTCTGRGEGWARVQTKGGKLGYCKEASLTEDNPNDYNVTLYAQKAGLKVYERASTSSDVLMTLSLNSKVQGVAISSDKSWIRLYNGKQYGYVQAKNFATSAVEDEGSSSKTQAVIDLAVSLQGIPYVFAAQSPSEGFDCSGFTYYVFKKAAGVSLKRTAKTQGYNDNYEKIERRGDLKVGDLVFFNTVADDDDLCDHVGIYIGSNQFIHASSGGKKVMISSLGSSSRDYYYRTYSWARRVL